MADSLDRLKAALADRYRIEREIGSGGMATVYLAEDLKHHRRVAIKMLKEDVALAIGTERFLREVEIAARLTHPHILPLLDSGAANGLLYYSMPFAEGATLRDRIEREKQLPIEDALSITCSLAIALDHAHQHQVIHRDIKPENILLIDDQPVIADFGIARAVDAAKLTGTYVSLGTPEYMSPEQAEPGSKVDERADLYSLGCVLYEMLAGHPPYVGATVTSLLAQHAGAPVPDVGVVRPTVSENVRRALQELLAKVPADRFATGAALIEALKATRSTARRGARRRVVVLPFVVHGRSDIAYLAEGMVSLLSTTLDGVGDLRCLDASTLLRWLSGEQRSAIDSELGKAAARRFDAGLFVLGEVLELGPRLRLQAALYESRPKPRRVARGTSEGPLEKLPELVDEITRDLVAGRPGRLPGQLVGVAAATTHSVPALKAYLEAERDLRTGAIGEAVQAYRRAVEQDPDFALAWYRLSYVSGWVGSGIPVDAASSYAHETSKRGAALAGKLGERDREILLAWHAYVHGEADEAERRYRSVLATRRDDLEAWRGLRSVLGLMNPARGRSKAEQRETDERLLELDPDFGYSVESLMELAAIERRWNEIDAIADRYLRRVPRTNTLARYIRSLREFYIGSPEGQDRAVADLEAEGEDAFYTLGQAAMGGGDLEVVLRIANATSLHRLAGLAEMARGRWLSAKAQFDRRQRPGVWPLWPPMILAYVASTTFLSIPRSDREEIRSNVDSMLTSEETAFSDEERRAFSPQAREYLLGLLSARLQQYDRALQHAQRLETLGNVGDPEAQAAASDFSASVRATVLQELGRAHEALDTLRNAQLKPWRGAQSGIRYRVYERFLLAELLNTVEEHREALRWFESVPHTAIDATVYRAPCHQRQAIILERLGRPDEAAEHYSRFIDIWKDCDPELRPMVDDARARMERLVAAKG